MRHVHETPEEYRQPKLLWSDLKAAGLDSAMNLECLILPLLIRNDHHILVAFFPMPAESGSPVRIRLAYCESYDKIFVNTEWKSLLCRVIVWYIRQHHDNGGATLTPQNFVLGFFKDGNQKDIISCGDHVIWKILQLVSNSLSKNLIRARKENQDLHLDYHVQTWNAWSELNQADPDFHKKYVDILSRYVKC